MKAQTSIEASLMITFMVFVLVVFMGVFAVKNKDTQTEREQGAFLIIKNILEKEIELAEQVSPGYRRNFSLPVYAGNLIYNVTLINSSELRKINPTARDVKAEIIILANESSKYISSVLLVSANVTGEICVGPDIQNLIEKTIEEVKISCITKPVITG